MPMRTRKVVGAVVAAGLAGSASRALLRLTRQDTPRSTGVSRLLSHP